MTSPERALDLAIGRAARRLRLDEDLDKEVDEFRPVVEQLIGDVDGEAMAADVIRFAMSMHRNHQDNEKHPTKTLRDGLASEDVRLMASTQGS